MTYLEPDVRLLGHRLCPICGQPMSDHVRDCGDGAAEKAAEDERDEQERISGWAW